MKKPTRREIEALPREALHIARNSTKADVYKLEWPPASGEFAVLKDMKKRPAWFRLSAGRWFLRREFRALQKLKGIDGVPRALAKPDADCVLMEWRAGTPLMDWKAGEVSAHSLQFVAEIVAKCHARGVIHGDLHRSNVLLTPEGQITLIDWATAGVFSARRNALKGFTFAEWKVLDVRAVAKLKARHAPDSVSEAEKEALLNGSKLYRFIRTAGFKIRKLFGHQRTKSPEHAAQRYKKFVESGAAKQNHKKSGDEA
ncbi:RIO1 family protein [Abditibacterium utsteinense]|uniref:non-specific serine/threonine protein kinase n=1 Tax=Abditibacterium utsteinense TaxID=1960156 RepID=A0A2S8SX52_9BACT|nr:RIO1 family regulatory kinase/ATPase [Abditibacterium utsteinense]PQV65381.1 RIO1 family protein [Abditibacterium utsteinense]